MRNQIRVLLVDDHELARRGLRRMLELSDEIVVVSEAGDADEALGQVEELSPDVVIMDIQMGHINGLEATQLLKDRGFTGAVLVLTMFEEYLEKAIQVGATGYLIKDAKLEELVSAIQDAARGRFIFGSSLLKSPDNMTAAFAQLQRQWSDKKLPAPQRGPDSQAADNAQLSTVTEEKTAVEQSTREPAQDAPEPSQFITVPDIADPADPMPPEAPDTVIKDVELVISPPVEPWMLLKLHRWLTEVANIDVGEMAGSLTGDTVVRGSIRRPIPFVKMLAELPDVAEVTEEPYVEGRGTLPSDLKSPGDMQRIGGGRTLPKRFRLALQAA